MEKVPEPALEDEPGAGRHDAAALLDSAEDIINEVAPDLLDEVRRADAKRERASNRWWRKKR